MLCDGRALSKHLFDSVTMPTDPECNNKNELNGSASSETQLCQVSLEPEPVPETNEVPQTNVKTVTTVSTPSSQYFSFLNS